MRYVLVMELDNWEDPAAFGTRCSETGDEILLGFLTQRDDGLVTMRDAQPIPDGIGYPTLGAAIDAASGFAAFWGENAFMDEPMHPGMQRGRARAAARIWDTQNNIVAEYAMTFAPATIPTTKSWED